MDILLRDGFRRTLVQFIVGCLFAVISLPTALLFVLVIVKQIQGGLQGWVEGLAGNLATWMSYPIDQAPAQVSAVLVSTLPALVGVVCFRIVAGTPPKQSESLNGLGMGAVIGLVAGAVAGLVLVIWFNVDVKLLDGLVAPDVAKSVKLVVTGIMSFQFIYIIKLLGLENVVPKP